MVTITKFVYKAFDGKEFESKDECEEYEKKNLKINIPVGCAPGLLFLYTQELRDFIKDKIIEYVHDNYDSYISNSHRYRDINYIHIDNISINRYTSDDKYARKRTYKVSMSATFKNLDSSYVQILPDLMGVLCIPADTHKIEEFKEFNI